MNQLGQQEKQAEGGPLQSGNVFLGLDGDHASQIEALRKRGEFFWLDLDLDSDGIPVLGELLQIREQAIEVLGDFRETTSLVRRSYTDESQVVFPFFCCVDTSHGSREYPDEMQSLEVHVLVGDGCIVTVHHGPCGPLTEFATKPRRASESLHRLVYTVLLAMVGSIFESLEHLDDQTREVEDVFDEVRTGRRTIEFIKNGRRQLSRLRSQVGPQLVVFEQVADELTDLTRQAGDQHRYYTNIRNQLSHALDSIDAANNALSGLLDLRLTRTTFMLTVVAAVFLPLTFLTGFFGQNFNWLLSRMTSAGSFWLLGIGSMLLSLLASLWVIRMMLGPRPGHHSGDRAPDDQR
ncbi:MAG: magnesium transporter CorA family protein [Nocardioidaceae bacterium]